MERIVIKFEYAMANSDVMITGNIVLIECCKKNVFG